MDRSPLFSVVNLLSLPTPQPGVKLSTLGFSCWTASRPKRRFPHCERGLSLGSRQMLISPEKLIRRQTREDVHPVDTQTSDGNCRHEVRGSGMEAKCPGRRSAAIPRLLRRGLRASMSWLIRRLGFISAGRMVPAFGERRPMYRRSRPVNQLQEPFPSTVPEPRRQLRYNGLTTGIASKQADLAR